MASSGRVTQRKRLCLVCSVAVVLVSPTTLSAQSLVDLARQEQARRESMTPPSRVYTNDDLGPAPPSSGPQILDQEARRQPLEAALTRARARQEQAVFQEPVTLEHIILLAEGGLSDETIIAFLETRPLGFVLSAEDIVRLRQAGVSERVIRYLLQRTPARPTDAMPDAMPGQPYDRGYYTGAPFLYGYGAVVLPQFLPHLHQGLHDPLHVGQAHHVLHGHDVPLDRHDRRIHAIQHSIRFGHLHDDGDHLHQHHDGQHSGTAVQLPETPRHAGTVVHHPRTVGGLPGIGARHSHLSVASNRGTAVRVRHPGSTRLTSRAGRGVGTSRGARVGTRTAAMMQRSAARRTSRRTR